MKLVWLTETGTSFGQFSYQFLFLITWDWFKSLSLVWLGPSLQEENYSECTSLWKQESDTILPTCKSCWLYGVWWNKFAKFSLSCESALVVHWLIDWLMDNRNSLSKVHVTKKENMCTSSTYHTILFYNFLPFFRKISWGKYPYPPQGRSLEIPRGGGSQRLIFLMWVWGEYNVPFGLHQEIPPSFFQHRKCRTSWYKKCYMSVGKGKHCSVFFSLRKQLTFRQITTWPLAKRRLSNVRRNSKLMSRHYPDLGSTSDWLKFPRISTNQKHYLDLGSDTSSAWNFCTRYSDVVLRGLKLRPCKTSTICSGLEFFFRKCIIISSTNFCRNDGNLVEKENWCGILKNLSWALGIS